MDEFAFAMEGAASPFKDLLKRLLEEHENEVNRLREEIDLFTAQSLGLESTEAELETKKEGPAAPAALARKQHVVLLPQWAAASAAVEKLVKVYILQEEGELTTKHRKVPRFRCRVSPAWIRDPNAPPILTWIIIGMILLLVDVIMMPLQVFFDPEDDIPFYNIFGQSVCVFWTLDMLVNMFAGFHNKNGQLILSSAAFCRYAKSWLLLDLLVVSTDWLSIISDYMGGSADGQKAVPSELRLLRLSKMTRFLRALRALRVLRLAKAASATSKLQESVGSESLLIIGSAITNICVLLLMNHWICCLWYTVGTHGGKWVEEYHVKELSVWGRYVMSLHWSLTQFTPAGMHVQPHTVVERTFAVLMIIIAMLSFSTFVSSITASMTGLRQMAATKRKQWGMLTKYFGDHHLNPDLRLRLIGAIEAAMKHNGHSPRQHEVLLLRYLSAPLKIELQLALHEPQLAKHPFFAAHMEASPTTCPELFEQALVDMNVGMGGYLFRFDEHARTMFFLLRGALDYRPGIGTHDHESSDIHSIKLFDNCHISEPALWIDWYYAGTLRSMQESEVIVLDTLAFYKAIKVDPRAVSHACHYAKDFAADMANELENTGAVYDLESRFVSNRNFLYSEGHDLKRKAQEKVGKTKAGWRWTKYRVAFEEKAAVSSSDGLIEKTKESSMLPSVTDTKQTAKTDASIIIL